MAAGHTISRLSAPGVVFDQYLLPGLVEFVELHLAGQHVGNGQLLALVRAVQQPHGEELSLGLDDQVGADMAVVHRDNQAAGVDANRGLGNACQVHKGESDADGRNHQRK